MNLVGDLLTLDFRRRDGVDGWRLFSGRVEASEDLAAEARRGDWDMARTPSRDKGCSECFGVLGDVFQQRATLHQRQGDVLDNFHIKRTRGDRDGGREREPPWRPRPRHSGNSLDAAVCSRPS